MRALLAGRGLRRLLAGQTVSALGDWIGTIAVMVLVHDLTDSATAVGGVLVLRLLPALIAGPLAARLVRRWGRRRTMLAADAVRAGMVVLIPFVHEVWWVYLWSTAVEAVGLVFLPARDAAVPDLVREAGEDADLAIANGLVLASSYATIPFGAAAFGGLSLLAEQLGFGITGRYLLVFVVDAVTFLVSFVAVLGIPGRETQHEAVEPDAAPASFRAGLRLPLVRAVLPAVVTVAMGVGSLFSIGVSFVTDVLHASQAQFGVLIALFGVGAVIGLGAARLLDEASYLVGVRIAVAAQGGVIVAMSLAAHLSLAFLAAAGFGAAAAATLVAGMSVLQTRLDGTERDLAFAVFHVVIRAGLGLAAVAAGGAADLLAPVRWPLVGRLPADRVVLLSAGLLVLLSAVFVREPAPRQEPR